jgi:hypothetical protein
MNVATGEVSSTATASSISLSLSNVSTTAGQEITLYAAVLPTETGALTLTATTSDGKSYEASVSSKTLVAGRAYRYTVSELVASTTGTENGYTWVDLGLSVKWATMNVGATSVTDYGKYYAWGETKAYREEDQTNASNYAYEGYYTKTYYDWSTYKWSNDDNGDSFSKYTTSSKTTLDAEDDAATQNWGGAWRMPTHYERNELVNNCYWVWTSSYNGSGVAGYIVYAAKSPSDKGQVVYNGNTPSSDYSLSDSHIFLPAAGDRGYSSLYSAGTSGYYWSSSLYDGGSYGAWGMCFGSDYRYSVYGERCGGQSVRAVCK